MCDFLEVSLMPKVRVQVHRAGAFTEHGADFIFHKTISLFIQYCRFLSYIEAVPSHASEFESFECPPNRQALFRLVLVLPFKIPSNLLLAAL